MINRAFLILSLILFTTNVLASEGKWTPEQLHELPAQELTSLGLELPPAQLWSREGGGLLDAAVTVNDCSGGFVSAEGLLVTNFHCAFPILQQNSQPDRDLTTLGFLAQGRDQELPGNGVRVTIPVRRTDVTAAIAKAVPAGTGDRERSLAVERKKAEITAECAAGNRCDVVSFDDGLRYLLIESRQYTDVRLVYSPPQAIGDFGGQEDNWSWPRHNADIALLRVWAGPDGNPAARAPENVPYRPARHFRVSTAGVKAGDAVLVAGYPASSSRGQLADELAYNAELYFPRRIALDESWIGLMKAASERDEAARLALADRLRRMENLSKSARGQLEGLRRGQILERKREQEREVLAWAAGRPDQAQAVTAYNELKALLLRRRETWDRDFLLELLRLGPKPLEHALVIEYRAHQHTRPDAEREPGFRDRNQPRLEEQLRNDQKRVHLPTEEALLSDLLCRFAALPPAIRVPAAEAALPQGRDAAGCQAAAAAILAGTRVTDVEERIKMARETPTQLRARRDPLLELAAGIHQLLLSEKSRGDEWLGALQRLRPQFRRAVLAHAGRPVAPDANGTLRITFGQIRGYSPRDAVWMQPQTTLSGLLARDTGQMPYLVPAELRSAAAGARGSRFADPVLKDLPLCFLADADTGGGSSGSPVLNGRGELVGVNFDRVWENAANDYGYNPDVARNSVLDIRYPLWLLSTLGGEAAKLLLQEMGVPL